MLDHYERSELKASVVNAMIAAFIETPMDSESIAEMFGESVDDYLENAKIGALSLRVAQLFRYFPAIKFLHLRPAAQIPVMPLLLKMSCGISEPV